MVSLNDLAQIRTISDVEAGASCDYYSFILGLKDIGTKDIYQRVTELNFILHKHGRKLFHKLKQYVMYRAIAKQDKERAITYWKIKTLNGIFKQGANLREIVNNKYWWHCMETSAIKCNLFQVNMIIHSIYNPRTLGLKYSNSTLHTEKDVIKMILNSVTI